MMINIGKNHGKNHGKPWNLRASSKPSHAMNHAVWPPLRPSASVARSGVQGQHGHPLRRQWSRKGLDDTGRFGVFHGIPQPLSKQTMTKPSRGTIWNNAQLKMYKEFTIHDCITIHHYSNSKACKRGDSQPGGILSVAQIHIRLLLDATQGPCGARHEW
jgi:hypothetical protein